MVCKHILHNPHSCTIPICVQCGGAQTHTKPTRRRRRRNPNATGGPSNHTGRQTAKRRKAGARVLGKDVFVGEGIALADSKEGKGTGFRKQAGRYVWLWLCTADLAFVDKFLRLFLANALGKRERWRLREE